MTAGRHKPSRTYPTLVDAWATILGAYLFLFGAAGILYIAGHAHGRTATYPAGLIVPTFGFLCVSIILLDIASSRYISQVYKVSWWRQAFRWRSTNFRQGIGAFSLTNLKVCARIIGLNPSVVTATLFALITLDVCALVTGLVMH